MTKLNSIICGDATAELAKLPANCVDLILTDAPYLVGYQDRSGRKVANDDEPEAVLPAFAEMFRVLRPGSYAAVFCGWSAIAQFSAAWSEAGFRTVGQIIWPKAYASSAWHTECRHESAYLLAKGFPAKPVAPLPDVQAWVYSGNRSHPTEKAVEILTPIIRAYSAPGGVVLDPFAGSGSSLVAAALTGRAFLGIELEARHCETARARLAGVAHHVAKLGRAA